MSRLELSRLVVNLYVVTLTSDGRAFITRQGDNNLCVKFNYMLMAKAPLKKIAVPIADLISKIDRSALPAGDEEAFKTWLSGSINMQTTVETALRKGYSVKASLDAHNNKSEYWLQIVNPES